MDIAEYTPYGGFLVEPSRSGSDSIPLVVVPHGGPHGTSLIMLVLPIYYSFYYSLSLGGNVVIFLSFSILVSPFSSLITMDHLDTVMI